MAMRSLTPREIMQRPYERVLIPEEEGGYSAYVAEFEGCMAEGETPEEALRNLESTALAWIEAEQEAGRDIPSAWNMQEYSGKLLLRLPKSLHRQLARQASKEGVSLNQFVVHKLSEAAKENQLVSMVSGLINQGRVIQIYQIFDQADQVEPSYAGTMPEPVYWSGERGKHKLAVSTYGG
jgi:predicted RNase H-like HicB family nuclease